MKKLNKKGFTLIELLAIIVILAIIAVITVPIILNIIDNAREGARKSSVLGYAKAVELGYTQALYEKEITGTTPSSSASTAITIDGMTFAVDYDGNAVTGCTYDMTNGKLTLSGCSVDGVSGYSYNANNDGKVTKAS